MFHSYKTRVHSPTFVLGCRFVPVRLSPTTNCSPICRSFERRRENTTVARGLASCRYPCASSVGSCLPHSLDSTTPAGMEEAAGELTEVGRRRSRGRAHRGGEDAAGSSSSVTASWSRPGGRRPRGIFQLIHINSNLCYEKKRRRV
jgi:hypothetical protein